MGKKVTQFNPDTNPTADDLLMTVDMTGEINKKITLSSLLGYIEDNITSSGDGITACTTPTVADTVATWCDATGSQVKSTGVYADTSGHLGLGSEAYTDPMAALLIEDDVDEYEYYGVFNYTRLINTDVAGYYYGQLVDASAGGSSKAVTFITGSSVEVSGSGGDSTQLVGSISQVTGVGSVTDYIAALVTYAGGPITEGKSTPILYSLLINSPTYTTGGRVTDCYGIYIEDQANGAANSYSLYAAGDGKFHIDGLTAYANNAAAISGGLVAGDLYRTGGDPDTVCVVH